VTVDAPVAAPDRERLLTLLDLFGVARSVQMIRDGVVGAVSLRRELSALSGIDRVKRSLDTYFREQDHVLKVRSVLDALDRLTFDRGDGQPEDALARFRGDVESLRLDPVMHPVSELEAWHDCCSGKVDFGPDVMDEIGRMFRPGTVANRLGVTEDRQVMVDAARDGMVRWQRFMATEATPAQTKVGRIVRRSYQLIWSELQDG